MAYTHDKADVPVLSTGGLDTHSVSGTGAKGRWRPGIVPHIIRGASIQSTVTTSYTTAPKISLRKKTTGATSTTGNQFATLTMTTGASQGKPYIRIGLDQEIIPGEEVEVNVITAATASRRAAVSLYVEPRWETPAMITGAVTVTA